VEDVLGAAVPLVVGVEAVAPLGAVVVVVEKAMGGDWLAWPLVGMSAGLDS